MGSLVVDSANFSSERDVVKEEFRQGVLAPPYGLLDYAIQQNSFTTHPYRRPGIGSIEDLDAATLEDVRAFHRTFYRPDNAVLVVVGDFDPARLDASVDAFFGPIPRPNTPVPRVTTREPARTAERRVTVTAPNVPLPAVALTFLAPPATDPDASALRVAAAVLAGGESSRLYQALVYDPQLAQNVTAYPYLLADGGLFVVQMVVAEGVDPEAAETALLSELARLQTAPITEAEVERARNTLLTRALRERETNDGRASALARAVVLLGDARLADAEIGRLQAVTASDVQRALGEVLLPTNRLVVSYHTEPAD